MSSVSISESRGVYRARAYLGVSGLTGKQLRRQRSFPEARTRAEALELGRAWADAIEGGDVTTLLEEYVEVVTTAGAPKGRGPKRNTAAAYRSRARKWAAQLPSKPVGEITSRDIMLAERRMAQEGLSDSTVNGNHQFISSFFAWCCDLGLAEKNPALGVPHPKEARTMSDGRVFTLAEAARIAAWCEERLNDEDTRAWLAEAALAVMVMLLCGLRVSEATALRVRDVRPSVPDLLVCGTLTERGSLRRQAGTKGGPSRTVAMTRDLADAIAAHVAGRAPDEPVCGLDGGWLRPQRVRDALRACCADLGIEYRPPHALRHTHATLLVADGVSLRDVQARLGHSKSSTTLDFYAHALPGADAAAAARARDLLRSAC